MLIYILIQTHAYICHTNTCLYMLIQTHAHKCTCLYILIQTHAYIYIYIYTLTNTCLYILVPTNSYIYSYKHMLIYAHTKTYSYKHILIYAHTKTYSYKHMLVCTHTNTYLYMPYQQILIYAHTNTCSYTQWQIRMNSGEEHARGDNSNDEDVQQIKCHSMFTRCREKRAKNDTNGKEAGARTHDRTGNVSDRNAASHALADRQSQRTQNMSAVSDVCDGDKEPCEKGILGGKGPCEQVILGLREGQNVIMNVCVSLRRSAVLGVMHTQSHGPTQSLQLAQSQRGHNALESSQIHASAGQIASFDQTRADHLGEDSDSWEEVTERLRFAARPAYLCVEFMGNHKIGGK